MGSGSSVVDNLISTSTKQDYRIKAKVIAVGVLNQGGIWSRMVHNPPKMTRDEMRKYVYQKKEEKEEDWKEIEEKYVSGEVETRIRNARQLNTNIQPDVRLIITHGWPPCTSYK